MKTIEERAIEYAHQYRRDVHYLKGERADAAFAAYCQGAEDERKELTAHYEAEIAKYKCDLEESRERENIACKAVAEKRDKIARLTRWNDPKEEVPALLTRVLGRYSDGKNISVNIVYRRLTATGRNWFWTDGINAPLDIDGWREIH